MQWFRIVESTQRKRIVLCLTCWAKMRNADVKMHKTHHRIRHFNSCYMCHGESHSLAQPHRKEKKI